MRQSTAIFFRTSVTLFFLVRIKFKTWASFCHLDPVSETAQIRIRVAEPTQTFLRWQDASGKVVRNTPITLVEGGNEFSETVSELPAGVWFVSVGIPGVPAIRVVKE